MFKKHHLMETTQIETTNSNLYQRNCDSIVVVYYTMYRLPISIINIIYAMFGCYNSTLIYGLQIIA